MIDVWMLVAAVPAASAPLMGYGQQGEAAVVKLDPPQMEWPEVANVGRFEMASEVEAVYLPRDQSLESWVRRYDWRADSLESIVLPKIGAGRWCDLSVVDDDNVLLLWRAEEGQPRTEVYTASWSERAVQRRKASTKLDDQRIEAVAGNGMLVARGNKQVVLLGANGEEQWSVDAVGVVDLEYDSGDAFTWFSSSPPMVCEAALSDGVPIRSVPLSVYGKLVSACSGPGEKYTAGVVSLRTGFGVYVADETGIVTPLLGLGMRRLQSAVRGSVAATDEATWIANDDGLWGIDAAGGLVRVACPGSAVQGELSAWGVGEGGKYYMVLRLREYWVCLEFDDSGVETRRWSFRVQVPWGEDVGQVVVREDRSLIMASTNGATIRVEPTSGKETTCEADATSGEAGLYMVSLAGDGESLLCVGPDGAYLRDVLNRNSPRRTVVGSWGAIHGVLGVDGAIALIKMHPGTEGSGQLRVYENADSLVWTRELSELPLSCVKLPGEIVLMYADRMECHAEKGYREIDHSLPYEPLWAVARPPQGEIVVPNLDHWSFARVVLRQ